MNENTRKQILTEQQTPTPDRPLERDWARYCHEVTREAALRAVREDEGDE